MYKIGQVAKMLSTTARTIRYYESLGLIRPAKISEGGKSLHTIPVSV